ncbi:MAG: hypothetical protein ABIT83_21170 [Massilia sp.]
MTNRLAQLARQIGWLDALWYALARGLGKLTHGRCRLHKYAIVAQAVGTASLCRGRGDTIEVRAVAAAGADAAAFRRRASVIAARYGQGAECLAAYRAGELLGYLWFTQRPYQEDEVRARFVPGRRDAAWDFDIQVFNEHQLGLAFPRLWDEANRCLHARGVRWTCSRISAFNAGSRSAHRRIGAVLLGSAVFLCCGRWQWMAASMAPWFHLSRDADSYPQFRLAPS